MLSIQACMDELMHVCLCLNQTNIHPAPRAQGCARVVVVVVPANRRLNCVIYFFFRHGRHRRGSQDQHLPHQPQPGRQRHHEGGCASARLDAQHKHQAHAARRVQECGTIYVYICICICMYICVLSKHALLNNYH